MFSTMNHFQMFKPGSVHLTVALSSSNAALWQAGGRHVFPTSYTTTACSYCLGAIPADVSSAVTWKHLMLLVLLKLVNIMLCSKPFLISKENVFYISITETRFYL